MKLSRSFSLRLRRPSEVPPIFIGAKAARMLHLPSLHEKTRPISEVGSRVISMRLKTKRKPRQRLGYNVAVRRRKVHREK